MTSATLPPSGSYDLAAALNSRPAFLASLRLPEQPVTNATFNVINDTELRSAISGGNNRRINILSTAQITGGISLDNRSHLYIYVEAGARISGGVTIHECDHIRLESSNPLVVTATGGLYVYSNVRDTTDIQFINWYQQGGQYPYHWAAYESSHIRRVLILGSTMENQHSPWLGGGTVPDAILDYVIANSRMLTTRTPTAGGFGVRLTGPYRNFAIIDSQLAVWINNALRIHGAANQLWVARNQLEKWNTTGGILFIHPEAGVANTYNGTDILIENNSFYSLGGIPNNGFPTDRYTNLVIRNNRAYNNGFNNNYFAFGAGPGWSQTGNSTLPYQTPSAWSFR